MWLYFCKETKSKIYMWGFGCLFKKDGSTRLASGPFGHSKRHSGWALSVEQLLFWSLVAKNPLTLVIHFMQLKCYSERFECRSHFISKLSVIVLVNIVLNSGLLFSWTIILNLLIKCYNNFSGKSSIYM